MILLFWANFHNAENVQDSRNEASINITFNGLHVKKQVITKKIKCRFLELNTWDLYTQSYCKHDFAVHFRCTLHLAANSAEMGIIYLNDVRIVWNVAPSPYY